MGAVVGCENTGNICVFDPEFRGDEDIVYFDLGFVGREGIFRRFHYL